jgi:formylglycine-generating enzyme required for sulfatase activity
MALVGSFCIDVFEVTVVEYDAWLGTSPDPTSEAVQPQAVCFWNQDFSRDPSGLDEDPVGGVTWCAAYAYCRGVGKRLCGGRDGAVLDHATAYDPQTSEWTLACTQGGETTYPYGDTYDPAACNGYDLTQGVPTTPGELVACSGATPPFDRIYDLSGNAYEWEDACEPGATPDVDLCLRRGGSYNSNAEQLACLGTSTTLYGRNTEEPSLGIRCCADAL